MPYEGDSPTEAWEFWFDEPPSEEVRLCLEQRCKKHAVEAVLEAIAITGGKCPLITDDVNRLKYMSGVLRRTALREIDPERAQEETNIDMLLAYWQKKEISPWPPRRSQVREWLQFLSFDAIRVLMNVADGYRDFKDLIAEVIEKQRRVQAEEAAAAAAEIEEAARNLTIGTKRRGRGA